MQAGIRDWKHVESLIRLVKSYACKKISRWTSPTERLKSSVRVTLSQLFK